MLQQKVETHSKNVHKSTTTLTPDSPQPSQSFDDTATRSDDWSSQASSNNFNHLKHVDTRIKPNVMSRHRRCAPSPSATKMLAVDKVEACDDNNKKPLIAVWKTGAKLQNTSTSTASPASNESNGRFF